MIKININELLEKNNKSKYWLKQQMNMTSRNINRIIDRETKSIEFDTIETLCNLLNCTPGDLMTVIPEDTFTEKE